MTWAALPLQGKDEADQLAKISAVLGTPNESNLPGFSKLEL